MKLRKEKIETCRMCNKIIPSTKGCFKIKEKMIFPDLDGIWFAWRKIYICDSCFREIRKKVKEGVEV